MPRKPTKASGKARRPRASTAQLVVSHLTDEEFLLVFTDIVGRVAIQHYANLIARRDPKLSQDLATAVEAAGGWSDQELEAACAPEVSDAN